MSPLSATLLIFCSLLIFICHATDKCLAFSGGGIRAAIGAYFTMRRIETDGKLNEIKCISVISGGSWGFTMWLYEDKPGAVNEAILNWMYDHDMTQWGTKGPVEVSGDGGWFEKWKSEIQKHILDVTSLKDKKPPRFETKFRAQLNQKGLNHVTVYFVVEAVEPRISKVKTPFSEKPVQLVNRLDPLTGLAGFVDYCWFKSAPPDKDVFKCTKNKKNYPISKARIKQKDNLRRIHIDDVLAYCSSAWATQAGKVNIHKHTTKEFRIYEGGAYKSWRLVDAGGTFNDPLIPYMVSKKYRSSNNIEIWNFDFSHYEKDNKLANIFEINKLGDAMEKIGRKLKEKLIPKPYKGTKPLYTFNVNNRVIKHCPLYGKYSKDKLINYFDTMRDIKVWGVKRWSMMMYVFFEEEWSTHLKTLLKGF